MRTNIVLNDDLVDQAMVLTGIKTKRTLVDFSFRELIRQRQQPTKPALSEIFAELRALNLHNEAIFPVVARQNRPNPFAEDLA